MPAIIWETIEIKSDPTVLRSKILGGWLVFIYIDGGTGIGGVTFVPDPQYCWDGGSLP
jgi:hypothetical protein